MRAPYSDRDNLGDGYLGLRRVDSRLEPQQRSDRHASPRHPAQRAVRRGDRRFVGGGLCRRTSSGTRRRSITEHGWTVELRIPFSSLRYRAVRSADVGHPPVSQLSSRPALSVLFSEAAARRQLFHLSVERPDRPRKSSGRWSSRRRAVHERDVERRSRSDELGSPLESDSVKPHAGVDVKYTPNADNAMDFTIKPDFSQVEADTAQISVERTIRAVLSRKATVLPRRGGSLSDADPGGLHADDHVARLGRPRSPARSDGVRYTVLVADDKGGGSVILPGPNGSDLATQDFGSTDVVARVKKRDRPVVPGHAVHRSRGARQRRGRLDGRRRC